MKMNFRFFNYILIIRIDLMGTEEISNIWLQDCDGEKV